MIIFVKGHPQLANLRDFAFISEHIVCIQQLIGKSEITLTSGAILYVRENVQDVIRAVQGMPVDEIIPTVLTRTA